VTADAVRHGRQDGRAGSDLGAQEAVLVQVALASDVGTPGGVDAHGNLGLTYVSRSAFVKRKFRIAGQFV
jgi:hypothetical protein